MATPFTGLSYYKASVDLAGHSKIIDLGEELGVDQMKALGMWHAILSYVARYMPEDGDLSRKRSLRIAEACGWQGDSELLLKVLVNVGLVDEHPVSGPDSGTESGDDIAHDFRISRIVHGWGSWYSDISEARDVFEKESQGGKKGNHDRWHARKGTIKPDCEFCTGGESVGDITSRSGGDSRPDIHIVEKSREEKRREGTALSSTSQHQTPQREGDDLI